MGIEIKIERDGLIPGISKRQIQVLKRETLKDIAASWYRRYLPGKFTPKGAQKYNYKKRKTKEIRTGKIKKRKGGFPISGAPLIWTGDTWSLAQTRKISGTFKTAYCTMPIGHLNRYRPEGFASGQIRREITLVLLQEQRALAKEAEQSTRKRFSRKKRNVQINAN